MQIVNEYKSKLQQATTVSEKALVAAELHRIASTFNASQRKEYEEAMRQMHQTIEAKLPATDAVVEKAQSLMAIIEARRAVRV